ncbi:hypothetical protein EC973_007765 [Apophysomyces ossiformis]|uniref:Uncharacterized protein n=1 Tax=Apophysomyces ossiformis TaxID=679940 RepID=A0A8H7C0M1_9FUNG|nr:hypothetical protein EC973_007765 [Apophysomyces ossiformis]
MAIGYSMLIILKNTWALYASIFMITAGMGFQAPVVIGWSAINFPDLSIRAVAVAVVVMVGNLGGVGASFLYPLAHNPHYCKLKKKKSLNVRYNKLCKIGIPPDFGNSFNLVCAILGAVTSGMTGFLLYRENRRRARQDKEQANEAYAQDPSTGAATTGSATGSATDVTSTAQQSVTSTAAATTASVTPSNSPSQSISPSATTDATTTATTTIATTTSSSPVPSGCFSDSAFSSTDYFANNKLSPLPKDAQFSVEYHNTYKVVSNRVLNENYVLHCTQNPPNLTDFQSKTYIRIPVTNFAAIDTRAIGYLDLLKQTGNIVYVGNVSNVTSPCVSPMPTLFNESTVDRSKYDLAIYTGPSNDPKGVGLGLNLNASPLTLAQWVKYFALFTNQETESEQIFNNIQANYETFRDSINGASIAYKRNVTFMSYDPMSTKFSVVMSQYFQNLTADAGANLTTPLLANPGSPSSMKAQLQNSSLVLDLTPANVFQDSFDAWQQWMGYSKENITRAADQALEAFKTTKPYINNPDAPPFERHSQLWRLDLVANHDSLDWWTRGFARPDLIIQDLIQAQFPDFFKGGRDRMFLRHFSDNEASHQANQKSYQCNLDNFKRAERVQYANSAQDAPSLDVNYKFPLAGIIGGSIAGGLVVLACLAACIVMLRRKVKDRTSKRFTRLREDPLALDDKEPMMLMEPTNENTGRLGGSGSREMV